MPTSFCGRLGAIAVAKSTILIEGILGTKTSPPCILTKVFNTKLTPCSNEIQKRVIFISVIGMNSAFSASSFLKKGTTEPRDPETLPYRTTANLVLPEPTKLFAAVNNLSEQSLVAP